MLARMYGGLFRWDVYAPPFLRELWIVWLLRSCTCQGIITLGFVCVFLSLLCTWSLNHVGCCAALVGLTLVAGTDSSQAVPLLSSDEEVPIPRVSGECSCVKMCLLPEAIHILGRYCCHSTSCSFSSRFTGDGLGQVVLCSLGFPFCRCLVPSWMDCASTFAGQSMLSL